LNFSEITAQSLNIVRPLLGEVRNLQLTRIEKGLRLENWLFFADGLQLEVLGQVLLRFLSLEDGLGVYL
jgi:hypothetical protein